uniref:C2H2-type domain-containing protein n=1 Tax=Labrus bergylta TaxID=56723 RepID=A0A3Q3EUM2_9LABR
MTRHKRIHSGEKPFKCSVCDQRFSWCTQLKRHKCVGCSASEPHENQTELNREAETGADGENCGGPEQASNSDPERHVHPEIEVKTEDFSEFIWTFQLKRHKCFGGQASETHQTDLNREEEQEGARNSDPERHLHPEIEVKTEDFSEPETDDIYDDWTEIKEHESGVHTVDNIEDNITESDIKSLCCSKCGKTFKKKRYLTTHMKYHTDQKRFSCSECGKRFSRKGSLTRHMILHSGEKPFSCPVCSKRFNQKECLTIHMAHHRGEKPFSCSVCDQRFSWPFQLQRHTRVETGEDCGGPEQARNSDPERHKGPKTEEKIINCSQCGKTFKTKASVTRHMRIHTAEKTFSCSECGEKFIYKKSLTRHMVKHRGEKPVSCSECGKKFSRRSYLASHMGYHDEEKLLSCSECGRRFNCKGGLTAHMMTHRGEKSLSCSVCGKRFSSTANMTRHMRIHTGEKPFSCSICVKTFKQKSHLKVHLARHRGKKPFSCTVCDKRFMWTFQSLTRHMIIHSDEKPFSCSECNKTFNQKHSLTLHMAHHRGEKPFSWKKEVRECPSPELLFNLRPWKSPESSTSTSSKPASAGAVG